MKALSVPPGDAKCSYRTPGSENETETEHIWNLVSAQKSSKIIIAGSYSLICKQIQMAWMGMF